MKGMAKIAKPRREVLPAGALVLERLLKHLQPQRGGVLGVRHPRGPALRPAVGGGAAQGPAALLLRRLCPPALPLRRARRRAVPLDRRAVPAAGARRERGREAPALGRLPALRHQLARASRLSRRAEPDPDRPVGARRPSTIRAACSWPSPAISATSAPPARTRATATTGWRSASSRSCPSGSTGVPGSSARRCARRTCSRSAGPASSTRRRSPTSAASSSCTCPRRTPPSTASACGGGSPSSASCWSATPRSGVGS